MPKNLVDAAGNVYSVDDGEVAAALEQGMRLEGVSEGSDRAVEQARETKYGTVGGQAVALGAGTLRGATLGLSDVVLGEIFGEQGARDLDALRDVNPGVSTVGEVGGAIATALPSGGSSLLARAPNAIVSRAAARAGEHVAAGGLARRVAGAAVQGGIEGAAQGGGHYLTSVALEDKPLSAEAFLADVGTGAFFGGAVGGGLGVAEHALTRAKGLFPRGQVTREAADELEHAATTQISGAIDDGAAMERTARQQLDELRLEHARNRTDVDRQLAEIKLAEAKAKLAAQEAKTARAQNPPKRTRKAMQGDDAPPAPEPTPQPTAPGTAAGNDSTPELPATAADVTDDAVTTVDARAIRDRGYQSLSDPAKDKVKMEKARKAISEGQRDPITINVSPGGVYDLEDGTHRLAAAIEAGAPVKVRWRRGSAGLDYKPADPLMDQLARTKSALDGGAELGTLSNRADEVLAAGDPRAAALVDAVKRERMTRDEVQTWIKGRRAAGEQNAAERGYRVSHDNPGLMRARISTPIAAETEASALEAKRILGKIAPEERLSADQAVARMFGGGKPQAAAPVATLDDKISQALGKKVGEHADLGADLAEGAQKIAAHEAAAADLAEALGPKAPAAATERAKTYRAATAAKSESDAAVMASTADAMKTKLEPGIAKATGKAVDEGMLGKLADLGAGLEVLKAMGVPVPDATKIPVIGPVLGAYLKARAALSIFKRGGGSVPKTAEASIAGKAAKSRDRVSAAVRGALEVGAKSASKARAGAGAAAGLGVSLFPGGKKSEDKPAAQYRARMDELAQAAQPGAIAAMVRERVPTSDVMLQQEITSALERKLSFLSGKAPRPAVMPTMLKGDGEWHPPKPKLEEFARYVSAANDPIAVLEDAAAGKAVSIEAAETLRTVYPRLFQEAQMNLLERAQHMRETLPYTRRLMLSVLFQVPVDGSMSPGHVRFLQQAAQPAPSPAQGSPMAGAPPTPSLSGAVSLGDRTMTSLDRRAGA